MAQTDSKEIMARNIRKYMESRGISNQKLCDDLNIKYTTFLDWINAKTYPRIDKIEIIAQYFNIPKSELIENNADYTCFNSKLIDRMQSDENFKRVVEILYNTDSAKIAGIRQMLEAFK